MADRQVVSKGEGGFEEVEWEDPGRRIGIKGGHDSTVLWTDCSTCGW